MKFVPTLSIEEKRAIVEEWRGLDLTMSEFCRRKELSASTFEGWLNKFYPDRAKKTQQNKCMDLVKIQESRPERVLEMQYKGATIRFAQSSLREVLQVLDAVNG